MVKETPNIGLVKAEANDFIDFETHFNPNWDKLDTQLAQRAKDLEERGINVRQPPYSMKADGTDETTIFQQAVNDALTKGRRLYLPRGTYVFNTINSKVSIIGEHSSNTFIKKLEKSQGSTNTSIFNIVDTDNVSIENITFLHQTEATSDTFYLVEIKNSVDDLNKNITIKNCIFDSSSNSNCAGLVQFNGRFSNVKVIDSSFKGSNNPFGLSLRYEGKFHEEKDRFFIDRCHFDTLQSGVFCNGTTGIAPFVYLMNSQFVNLTNLGATLYHGVGFVVTNNIFKNITCPSASNNDNGCLWLDLYDPLNTRDDCVVANNVFSHITGNAIYAEEYTGSIVNNVFQNISKRTSDTYSVTYSYSGQSNTYTSDGGNGILITGGCNYTQITGNKFYEVANVSIHIHRALGAHGDYEVSNISVVSNVINSTVGSGIVIHDKIIECSILNNKISLNTTTTGIYGIRTTRTNTLSAQAATQVVINNNDIKAYNGIIKDYSAGYMFIIGNIVRRNPNSIGGINAFNPDGIFKDNADWDITTNALISYA